MSIGMLIRLGRHRRVGICGIERLNRRSVIALFGNGALIQAGVRAGR